MSFNVTVQDTTDPVLNLPANVVISATGPTPVNYAASASDTVDTSVAAICSPASGSVFGFGTTPVNCSATDDSGNQATGSFSVTVNDPGAPVVTPPADRVVEATSPAGAAVNFTDPATAVDNKDGPLFADCVPSSGTTFPLGQTTVTCSASDSDGNTGSGSFTVTVRDTTPPVLTVPGDLTVFSTEPVPSSARVFAAWLAFASAQDLVDPTPSVSNSLPAVVPIGVTTVVFVAEDDSGNLALLSRTITVLTADDEEAVTPEEPPPPSVEPNRAPANVQKVKAKLGNRNVLLRWENPGDEDFAYVEIFRSPGMRGNEESLVYRGAGERYRNKGLEGGVEYRYLIVAYDEAKNRAVGVAVVLVARETLLVAPRDGASLARPPRLRWKEVAGADYYNVQLFRDNRKVLSAWPKGERFKLPKSWRFEGRRYRLVPGRYTWYVWPGFGAKRNANYGELIGESVFVFRRR